MLSQAAQAKDGCTHPIVARVAKPSGQLQAMVDEAVCGGDYGSNVTATVRLVGPDTTRDSVPVLGVETGGHAEGC